MKNIHIKTIILLTILATGCSGGSGSGGASGTPVAAADFSAASSQDALKSNDLTTIKNTHCQAYQATPKNSVAAFGCAIATIADLMNSNSSVDELMTILGEPSLSGKFQSLVLGPSNPNSVCFKMASGEIKYLGSFPEIPFNGWDDPKVNKGYYGSGGSLSLHVVRGYMNKILLNLKQQAISPSQIQSDLYAIDNVLADIVSMLAVAKNDPSFNFTIPSGFCNLIGTHSLKPMDAASFYILASTVRIVTKVLHSYTVGLDFTKIVLDSGKINHAAFVADANGGDDGTKFAEIVSGQGDLSQLNALIQDTLNSIVTVIDTVKNKDDSVIFGRTLLSNTYKKQLQNIRNASKDLIASMQQNTLTPMTNFNKPNIKIDVNAGLKQLPDPKTVTTADPLVIDGKTNNIKAVANFWHTLLNGIATF